MPEKRTKTPKADRELIESIQLLQAAVQENTRYERLGLSTAYSLLKGVAYGLGALLAVAIVAPFFLWFMSSIAWPPIIANFVNQVIDHVQQARP